MDKMLLLKAKEKNAKQKKYRISYLIGVCLLGLSVSLELCWNFLGLGCQSLNLSKEKIEEATDAWSIKANYHRTHTPERQRVLKPLIDSVCSLTLKEGSRDLHVHPRL